MSEIDVRFATQIYRATLSGTRAKRLNAELLHACRVTAREDRAGQAWARKNAYVGYTSYASLNDLPLRLPSFAELQTHLDAHVAKFARALDLDLGRKTLSLDSLWINILKPGGVHTSHIHPHSVISGTYYVAIPKGASALKFEDPRLGLMMAAPMRKPRARPENQSFVYLEPKAQTVVLWESWLRHEVPMNAAREDRVSISFNYGWA